MDSSTFIPAFSAKFSGLSMRAKIFRTSALLSALPQSGVAAQHEETSDAKQSNEAKRSFVLII
jgi:hypothetical protein